MPKMVYRRFGRTGLKMPVFSCGGMRYQYKWQDVPLSEVPAENQDNLEAAIHRAVSLGINHIETARGYGSSERQLGCILPSFDRDSLIVQTKIGPENDPEVFRSNFMESLERLRLDYVDLLGIHGINDAERLDWSIRPGGCLEMARRLQQEGLVRYVGFSSHASLEILLDAICHQDSGGFDYVNLHWYYIFQLNWPAIEEATRRDMGVFIISPSDKGGMLYAPSKKLMRLCKPLHPMVFNDLFCLSHQQVHTLSIGAARPTDFDMHLRALKWLDDAGEVLNPIKQRLQETLQQAVGADFAQRYSEGLPSWQDTPGEVNIPIILWLYNLARAYDMTNYAKMRYNLLGNGGHWFPGQNAGSIDEIDLSPALENSPFAGRIPGLLRHAHALLHDKPKHRLSEGG
jgi:hypothetical protein